MPFDNRDPYGNPSISPTTQKSVLPTNNVPTIRDVMNGEYPIDDIYPHTRGNWAPGQDREKSYKEKGDDYKRRQRDMGILRDLIQPARDRNNEKWKVKVDGGSMTFMSLPLARKYMREHDIPFKYLSRIAQAARPIDSAVDVVADSIDKCFMVESLNLREGIQETGSAFCVAPNRFLTCAHVIKKYNKNQAQNKADWMGSQGPTVNLIQNGRRFRARVIDVDTRWDLALLEAEISIEPFRLGIDSRIGEDIVAIGSPHGYENNVSSGVISSEGRKIYSYRGAPDYMFFDASVLPGSSGGPIVRESDGAVIGIVTLIISTEGAYGLNAALDSAYIQEFLKKHLETE